MPRVRSLAAVCLLLIPAAAWAQVASGPAPARSVPAATPAPRSPDGRLLVVAAPATGPVRIDGRLDDDVWRTAAPVSGFVQSEPLDGQPATDRTDVRVAYDKDTLYIAAVCHDRAPRRGVISQIREDFTSSDQDTFEVILDTFADRRNGFVFITNRAGARSDQQVANEGREINASWDAVWFVRTQESAEGWTVEMAVPFTSLRFNEESPGGWGINFSRRIRRKNEVDFWSPVSRAYNLARVSLAGNLGGLPDLRAGTEPADQAVPHEPGRSSGRGGHYVRHRRSRRAGRQVRRHARADPRRHRQPGFRPGRSRRPHRQSHPVHDVSSGEATVLHRELRVVLCRRCGANQPAQRDADP